MEETTVSILTLLVMTQLVCAADFAPPAECLYPPMEAQCGPKCLMAALAVLGRDVDYRTIVRDAGTDWNGTSILGLVRACEKQGIYSKCVRVKPSMLWDLFGSSEKKLVAICHQDPDHFV